MKTPISMQEAAAAGYAPVTLSYVPAEELDGIAAVIEDMERTHTDYVLVDIPAVSVWRKPGAVIEAPQPGSVQYLEAALAEIRRQAFRAFKAKDHDTVKLLNEAAWRIKRRIDPDALSLDS